MGFFVRLRGVAAPSRDAGRPCSPDTTGEGLLGRGGSISRDGEERRCNDSGGGEVRKKKEWRKLWEGRRKEKQEERKEESRLSEKKPGKGVRSGREEGPCTKARERKEGGGEEAIELREGLL